MLVFVVCYSPPPSVGNYQPKPAFRWADGIAELEVRVLKAWHEARVVTFTPQITLADESRPSNRGSV